MLVPQRQVAKNASDKASVPPFCLEFTRRNYQEKTQTSRGSLEPRHMAQSPCGPCLNQGHRNCLPQTLARGPHELPRWIFGADGWLLAVRGGCLQGPPANQRSCAKPARPSLLVGGTVRQWHGGTITKAPPTEVNSDVRRIPSTPVSPIHCSWPSARTIHRGRDKATTSPTNHHPCPSITALHNCARLLRFSSLLPMSHTI